MSDLGSEDVLFVGKNVGVVPYYRTGMPAFHLGCDWVCLQGRPPEDLLTVASLQRKGHASATFDDYRVVVLQQPEGPEWEQEILRLRDKGVVVLYEVDDYLHGVQHIPSHRAARAFSKERMPEYERCMRACDGMIVSTEWLQHRYAEFNEQVFVCRNAIDCDRYDCFSLPKRPTLNIGWAGGEGHLESAREWLPAVKQILEEHPETRFISMGLPIAKLLRMPTQAVALPFISIENFPGALCSFDISIAPAGRGDFFAAKSDLRWLETGALGIPLVADPFVYREIEHGTNGLSAETPDEAYGQLKVLVDEPDIRTSIAKSAYDYVHEKRNIATAVEQWESVFVSLT